MFWSFLFLFYAILRRHAGERDSDLHVDGRLAQGDHRARQRGQPWRQEVSLSLEGIVCCVYSGSGSYLSGHSESCHTKNHPGFFCKIFIFRYRNYEEVIVHLMRKIRYRVVKQYKEERTGVPECYFCLFFKLTNHCNRIRNPAWSHTFFGQHMSEFSVFRRGTYFDFALVFPDLRLSQVNYQSRKIGTTVAGQKVNKRLSVRVSGPDPHWFEWLDHKRGFGSRCQNCIVILKKFFKIFVEMFFYTFFMKIKTNIKTTWRYSAHIVQKWPSIWRSRNSIPQYKNNWPFNLLYTNRLLHT